VASESLEARYAELREIAAAAGFTLPGRLPEPEGDGALTLAVVGEFNSGKSTLVNALVGADLLPTAVTPTTAVMTELRRGEQEEGVVEYFDGGSDRLPPGPAQWRALVADEQSAARIKAVRLVHPAAPAGLVILDTPGTNDLSLLRTEALYQALPAADAVLFLMHACQPLKKTEVDFLRERILANDLTRLIFVINHMDQVDEDERDEVCDYVRVNLARIFGEIARDLEEKGGLRLAAAVRLAAADLTVVPLSALGALRARLAGDARALEESGLPALQDAIRKLVESSPRAVRTEERLALFIERGIRALRAELQHQAELAALDRQRLAESISAQAADLERSVEELRLMRARIESRVADLHGRIQHSCRTFFASLAEPGRLKRGGNPEQEVRRFLEGQVTEIRTALQAILPEPQGADLTVRDLRWSGRLDLPEDEDDTRLSFAEWITSPLCYGLMYPAALLLGPLGVLGVLAWPLVGGLLGGGERKLTEEQLAELRTQVQAMGETVAERLCSLADNLTGLVYGRLLSRIDAQQLKLRAALEAWSAGGESGRRAELMQRLDALAAGR